MSHNIYDILKRYDSLNENIDAAQRSVKQLPALFKPKNTSPQLSGPYPGKNATLGYLVGEDEEITPDPIDEVNTPQINRGGYNKLRDKEDYLDKRDVLFRLLSQSGIDAETKSKARERLADLDRAARQDGIIKENQDDNPVARAILHRIMMQHTALLGKYGPAMVMAAVDDVADFVGDVEEIGSSDVSGWVRQVEKMLAENPPEAFGLAEGATTEDVISSVKKKLGDYLSDLSKEIKSDPDLKDKLPQDIDQIKTVKTITTDDGHEIKIHGNEDDGFRVSIKNKQSNTRFDNLDEAIMACEMFCARRKMAEGNADYVEEKR